MNELAIPIAIMGTVAFLLGLVTARMIKPPGANDPRRTAATVVSISVLSSLGLLFFTKDRLGWAHWITSSDSIIYSNWTVLTLAIAAGAMYRLPNRPRWRQVLGAAALGTMGLAAVFQPALQPIFRPTVGGDSWDRKGVCLQSTPHNCSAAAGATLLKAHGFSCTEKQMVTWCLTDARGTPSLGLWRGLSLATRGTGSHPVALSVSADQLIQRGPWPCVMVVGLPLYGADPIYQHKYGWAPGFRHSVVLLGITSDGMLDIGDPSIGRESWAKDDLRVLYRGEAIALDPAN